MIKLEKTEVWGFEHAIRGMRNPLESWNKSDSGWCREIDCGKCRGVEGGCDNKVTHRYNIGDNDLSLMKRLIKAGTDRRKFLRQIFVSVDITAPLYWWKEFETYKVGTVANSTSTMHKIHTKEFTIDDFSCEHLESLYIVAGDKACDGYDFKERLKYTVMDLNIARRMFNETNDKRYWWQMIQLLPSSYNQTRTVTMSYENIYNMYHSRNSHKLDEWRVGFCEWVKALPYAEDLIIGKELTVRDE